SPAAPAPPPAAAYSYRSIARATSDRRALRAQPRLQAPPGSLGCDPPHSCDHHLLDVCECRPGRSRRVLPGRGESWYARARKRVLPVTHRLGPGKAHLPLQSHDVVSHSAGERSLHISVADRVQVSWYDVIQHYIECSSYFLTSPKRRWKRFSSTRVRGMRSKTAAIAIILPCSVSKKNWYNSEP